MAVLGLGAVTYMRYVQSGQVVETNVDPQPVYVEPLAPPVDPVVESAEEAAMVEEKNTPSDSTEIDAIEADADIADIEKDLNDLDGLELEIDSL